MSLWTPSGEHPVGDRRPTQQETGPLGTGHGGGAGDGGPGGGAGGTGGPGGGGETSTQTRDHDEIDELRSQLADAPADVVVANHCYGLFELAAVYLSQSPPRLEPARLAIDALACLVDGLGERLGEAHPSLRDALAQIRLAYVQISAT